MNAKRLAVLICVLAVCIGSIAACQKAPAKTPEVAGEIIVGTFGGDYSTLLKEQVDPIVAAVAPNLKIVYAVGQPTERMTKLRAEKDTTSSYDVICLLDTNMESMKSEGLLLKMNPSKIPNWTNIMPSLQDDYYVPHITSDRVLIYNKNKITPAPTSWKALWDPAYKGRVGIEQSNHMQTTFIAAAIKGKAYTNQWDDAWDFLLEMKDSVDPNIYPSQEALGNALRTEEVWLAHSHRARAIQWSKGSEAPLGFVVPEEGSFPSTFVVAVPKNAKNTEGAYLFLNALLDSNVQTAYARKMGYNPTVTNATLPDDLKATLGLSAEELSRIKPYDFSYVNENDPRWKEKWDKEFAGR